MQPVTIYTTAMCPYCFSAKRLLTAKNVDFTEIDVSFDRQKRAEMTKKADGRTSVPQIWIGDIHVGGSDELHALERQGQLDGMLALD